MQHPPVHWYEGLFLRPHHLQAAERYWTEQLHTGTQWDNAYHYGLHLLEFSREALANHQFDVRRLQARMRDGTLVNLDLGQEPDRVDLKEGGFEKGGATASLKEAFEKTDTLRVYLAAPKLKLGRRNVAEDGESVGDARFHETRLNIQDESWGGGDQEVQFKELNAKLLLSTQDLSGYELLPIAQIKRASEGEASPELDTSYIPPLLCTDAWPVLSGDIVRALFDIIGQKSEVLTQQIVNRGIGLENRDPGDADRILMLNQLNVAYATLSVLAFANGVHPLVVYTELCRVLGQLSIFGADRRASDIPPYDHDDLARIFFELRRRIEALIHSVRDYEFQQRYFVGVGLGMQVTLEPKWFNSDWQWFIGVNKGDLTHREIREMLSPGHLDWKFGSSQQVEFLFKHRAQGLELIPVDRPIRALPARQEWLYYEIPRKDAPAWRDVQETQTLALRMKDSLIVNRDRLQGERRIVVSALGKNATLEFALFAVPAQS